MSGHTSTRDGWGTGNRIQKNAVGIFEVFRGQLQICKTRGSISSGRKKRRKELCRQNADQKKVDFFRHGRPEGAHVDGIPERKKRFI